MKVNKNKLISILGPTASGKSDLGIYLAKRFGGDVISVDSRQIYKDMNIATGKVVGELNNKQGLFLNIDKKNKIIHPFVSEKVNHWMIDIANPQDDFFSVAQFQDMAYQIIFKLFAKKTIPILVGGSGLYMDAILKGYQFPKTSLRLRRELERFSDKQLLDELKRIDRKTYNLIDKKNRRRILRAIESYLVNKESHSKCRQKKPNFDSLVLAINWPREELYKRIDHRVEEWMKQGLIKEVRRLHNSGVDYQKLEKFGLEYRNVALYLQGKISRSEMIHNMKYQTHAFARRQFTWFRRNKDIIWLKADDKKIFIEAGSIVKNFITNY
jgi:tRNA dimethylallyltransferase